MALHDEFSVDQGCGHGPGMHRIALTWSWDSENSSNEAIYGALLPFRGLLCSAAAPAISLLAEMSSALA